MENVEKKLPNAKGITMNLHGIQPKYFWAFNQQANQDHCLDQQEEELSKKLMTLRAGLNAKRAVENISTTEKQFIQQHNHQ